MKPLTINERCKKSLSGRHVPHESAVGVICGSCQTWLGAPPVTVEQRSRVRQRIAEKIAAAGHPGATERESAGDDALSHEVFMDMAQKGEIEIAHGVSKRVGGRLELVYRLTDRPVDHQPQLI